MTSDSYINSRYACTEIGSLGERLIAVADWRLPPRRFPPGFQFSAQNVNFPLSGFRLLGIVSLFDPPRPTVPDSIAKCQAAGIKIIMMTGKILKWFDYYVVLFFSQFFF